MSTKITITLSPVDGRVPRERMAQAVALLNRLHDAPTAKAVLTIECADSEAGSDAPPWRSS